MKDKLFELFAYNFHTNEKLIEYVLQHFQEIPINISNLLNHVLNAHQIWNARINNKVEFEVWQTNEPHLLSKINEDNYATSLAIIHQKQVENSLEYINAKGQIFTNKIDDILLHIINHSTYHRAQIATELRRSGISPINTDYIFYKRSMEV